MIGCSEEAFPRRRLGVTLHVCRRAGPLSPACACSGDMVYLMANMEERDWERMERTARAWRKKATVPAERWWHVCALLPPREVVFA